MLSYKVLQVDVNPEHGQIRKVSETRLKLWLEDLARVPPVGIIKGLLMWPDNCMLLHVHLHVYRFRSVPGAFFFCAIAVVGSLWIIGGQHVFCAARRLASEREKKNLDPLRWQLEFECMVPKWDTPLHQRRRLAGHQQTARLLGTRPCMSERAALLMENLEEPENADLSLTDVCRQMLEEAALIADEGSLVCDCCSDAHYCPGP